MTKDINRIAIIGTGAIGANWAALLLAKGIAVVATDIALDAKPKLDAFIAAARWNNRGSRLSLRLPVN
jgi:3-hydroxyacyl-CoA dehydrogenase